MSTAYQRHGEDCHGLYEAGPQGRWVDINCKKCGNWIDEWYDKNPYSSKPHNVCDRCEEKQYKKKGKCNLDAIRLKNVKKMFYYLPATYVLCPETYEALEGFMDDDFGTGEVSAWCDHCNTSHERDYD